MLTDRRALDEIVTNGKINWDHVVETGLDYLLFGLLHKYLLVGLLGVIGAVCALSLPVAAT